MFSFVLSATLAVLTVLIAAITSDYFKENIWSELGFLRSSEKSTTQYKMNDNWENASSVYDFTVKDIKGEDVSLEKYRGHVLIIVNVASQCGLTDSNYKELIELDEMYRETKGLRILAFPCNQFGKQEPGNSEEIVCFVQKKKAKFDIFEKVDVNGNSAHPLWKYLKMKQGSILMSNIKWNFTKFLIDKNGQPVERYGPMTGPLKMVKDLEKYW